MAGAGGIHNTAGIADGVELRRIAPKTDVLNRHCVGLDSLDVASALTAIQQELHRLMTVKL